MVDPQVPEIKLCVDASELAVLVADMTNSRIRSGLEEKGIFHLALTGGTLGILISEVLLTSWNREPEQFEGLHLWWGDERFVPEMSEERNAHPILLGLGEDSPIHVHQVSSPNSHIDVEVAAKRYNADLLGINLDLMLLGVGPDGHVASLFPALWDENEKRSAIAILHSPKPPPQRVSLSMSKINASESVWFVISGGEKCAAVQKIVARDGSIPATHVHGMMETLLFVDRAAFASE